MTTEPKPADTGDDIASLAGKYANIKTSDIVGAICSKPGLEEMASDIRRMAASLLRQNER